MNSMRIRRSRNERIVAGVAGGLASYLGIDPLLVRLIFVILGLANGFGLLLYVLMWVLLPNEDTSAPDARAVVRENTAEIQAAIESLIDRARAAISRP